MNELQELQELQDIVDFITDIQIVNIKLDFSIDDISSKDVLDIEKNLQDYNDYLVDNYDDILKHDTNSEHCVIVTNFPSKMQFMGYMSLFNMEVL